MAKSKKRGGNAPIVLRIKLRYDDEDLFVERLAPYITRGGMFLRSNRAKPVGKPLIVLFKLADDRSIFEFMGRVKWARPPDSKEGPPGMGVVFIRVSPEHKAVMEKILEARTARGLDNDGPIPYSPGSGGRAYPRPKTPHPVPGAPGRRPTSITADMPRPVTLDGDSLADVAGAAVAASKATSAARKAPSASPRPAPKPAPARSSTPASPAAGRGPQNGSPAGRADAGALLAQALREADEESKAANDLDLEAAIEGLDPAQMPDLERVLARARTLAKDGGDEDLDALLTAAPADAGPPLRMSDIANALSGPASSAPQRPSAPAQRSAPAPAPRPAPAARPPVSQAKSSPGLSRPTGNAKPATRPAPAPPARVPRPAPARPAPARPAPERPAPERPAPERPAPERPAPARPAPASSTPGPTAAVHGRATAAEANQAEASADSSAAADDRRETIPLADLDAAEGAGDPLLDGDDLDGLERSLAEIDSDTMGIAHSASEQEYDEDDFPEIETLDQPGPSLGFLHVGNMAEHRRDAPAAADAAHGEEGADEGADEGAESDADDLAIDSGSSLPDIVVPPMDPDATRLDTLALPDDEDLDGFLDSALAGTDAMESELEGMLDDALGVPSEQADAPPAAAQEGSSRMDTMLEETDDLVLPSGGPSGLELALQNDVSLGQPMGSSPQIIAPGDGAGGDSTFVMDIGDSSIMDMSDATGSAQSGSAQELSPPSESVEIDFDSEARQSMSMAFDARALDADSIMDSGLNDLSAQSPSPTEATSVAAEEGQGARTPPLRAPPMTDSVPIIEDTSGLDEDSDAIEVLDLDDELLIIEDEDEDEDVSSAPPPPPPPPPPPGAQKVPPPPGLVAPSSEDHADAVSAHAAMDGDEDDGEGLDEDDGMDDGDGKKKGFFRRFFNK